MVAYLRQVPPVRHAIYESETPRAQLEPEHEAPTGGAPLRADSSWAAARRRRDRPARACLRRLPRARAPIRHGHRHAAARRPARGLPRGAASGLCGRHALEPGDVTDRGRARAAGAGGCGRALCGESSPKVPPLPDGLATDRGRQLALEGDAGRMLPACIACHGTQGIGIPPAFPYLAGQDPLYMTMQIRLWRHGHRRNDPLGAMAAVAHRLSSADAEAVSMLFARLAEPQPPSSRATASGTTSPANGLRAVTPASDEPSAISSESKVVQPARASVPSSSASQ